ncbi:uncharacterized protein Pyn_15689 [Prunus yedoensis var. nudiflora]|uniref:Uncharacterized protein n=1 Tax=Prunus yedoensis var. nudiflora TaxID=2094558 RepID=A0A314ZP91_PRUYE|nr:uncharacterized protein Pyn_15689 [Prunus yedoensis var. nudiflora]
MEAIAKSFVLVLLLSLISKGFCACTLNNINIGTTRRGREIGGKPEWNVVVTNNCACAQTSIVLSCKGFQTTEPVDPAILKSKVTCAASSWAISWMLVLLSNSPMLGILLSFYCLAPLLLLVAVNERRPRKKLEAFEKSDLNSTWDFRF